MEVGVVVLDITLVGDPIKTLLEITVPIMVEQAKATVAMAVAAVAAQVDSMVEPEEQFTVVMMVLIQEKTVLR